MKIYKKTSNNANFFGIYSQQELNKILNSQAHEVKSKLETFINQRQDALSKLDNIKNSLVVFNIKPRILGDSEYEIGFSFPEEYTELENLEDVLGDIKNFLVSLADALGESKSFKIKYVNNGSIDLFIGVGLELAQHFEKGVSAEVRTPSIPEPEEPSADAEEDVKKHFKEKKKLYELKQGIDKKNKEIFILQQNNFFGMNTKFLNEVTNDEDEKSKNNNESKKELASEK